MAYVHLSLNINCGYARTGIWQLSTANKTEHNGLINKAKRLSDFRSLFDIPSYKLPKCLFDLNGKS